MRLLDDEDGYALADAIRVVKRDPMDLSTTGVLPNLSRVTLDGSRSRVAGKAGTVVGCGDLCTGATGVGCKFPITAIKFRRLLVRARM